MARRLPLDLSGAKIDDFDPQELAGDDERARFGPSLAQMAMQNPEHAPQSVELVYTALPRGLRVIWRPFSEMSGVRTCKLASFEVDLGTFWQIEGPSGHYGP